LQIDNVKPHTGIMIKLFLTVIIITVFPNLLTLSQVKESGETVGGYFTCGKNTIDYEGKTYNTVRIGAQCWFKENLDAGTMVLLTADTTHGLKIKKYCYQNKPENCVVYGGLYQWNEAMRNCRTEGARGMCPEGWHIPSKSDFDILNNSVKCNSSLLKASGDTTAINFSGFEALFAGYRGYFSGTFASLGNCALFWTSTEYDNDSAINLYLTIDNNKISSDYNYKTNAFSVRCLKDE